MQQPIAKSSANSNYIPKRIMEDGGETLKAKAEETQEFPGKALDPPLPTKEKETKVPKEEGGKGNMSEF
jgi:hypothetical protein